MKTLYEFLVNNHISTKLYDIYEDKTYGDVYMSIDSEESWDEFIEYTDLHNHKPLMEFSDKHIRSAFRYNRKIFVTPRIYKNTWVVFRTVGVIEKEIKERFTLLNNIPMSDFTLEYWKKNKWPI